MNKLEKEILKIVPDIWNARENIQQDKLIKVVKQMTREFPDEEMLKRKYKERFSEWSFIGYQLIILSEVGEWYKKWLKDERIQKKKSC